MSGRPSTIVPAALLALAVLGVSVWALASARGGGPEAGPVAPVVARTPIEQVAQAQALIARRPRDDRALAQLAGASLDLARETGDPSWYAKADGAARRALAANPRNPDALDAMGDLANARHRFAEGLAYARRSRAAVPTRFAPYGIEADALVELGRYRRGFAIVERRLELRPDLPSYSRASYVQELRGNRAGAIRLMELAVSAGGPGSEGRAWTRVQLGLLRFGSGDLAGAEREMRTALAERPGDARATAGLARVLAARGRLDRAAALYRRAMDRLPLPEYPAALAEIDLARGRTAAARDDLALVGVMQRLLAANGVRVDLDLALIDADFHRPGPAAIARARGAHATRPGVVGDDVLGWVLTRAGRCRESLTYARRSLRLGTRDALMRFHAGMAASCAGRPAEAAARLRDALTLNPRFSVRWAPVARRTLERVAPS
jgi:tetratricopeptide (TPR) repeat protein